MVNDHSLIKVYKAERIAAREPVAPGLLGMGNELLSDLTWIDPAQGYGDWAWWPEDNQYPQLALYQSYGTEVLTPVFERQVVISSAPIVNWSAEQIAAYKAPIIAAQWDAIKEQRDGAPIDGGRSDGGVLVSGHWFNSDITSRVKWLGLKDTVRDMLAASALASDAVFIDGAQVMWKTMAGEFLAVTVQVVVDVVEAIKVLDARLFKAAELHRIAMTSAYDPATYDYSSGWPQRYVDTLTVAP